MKRSLLFGFFLIYFSGQGQKSSNGWPIPIYNEEGMSLPLMSEYGKITGLDSKTFRETLNNKEESVVLGSPYLFEVWNNPAKVFFRDKIYRINSFNYNIYAERFEAKLSEDSVFIINSWNVKKVIVNNRIFSHYTDPETQNVSYFEELAEFDNYRILSKHFVTIKSGPINPLTKLKLNDDAFIKKEVFYLCNLNDNSIKKIQLKKSDFQSLFKQEKRNELNKFSKNYHLNYRNIGDVKKIIQYYNTL